MTRGFLLKLAAILAPFVALFALPIAVLLKSWEVMPIGLVATAHAKAPPTSVYGAAYSNPSKGYKMAAIEQRQVPLVAIGTSRVMQFRSDFFFGGEKTFYNGGGVVQRLWDYRLCFRRIHEVRTRDVIVGLDQWAFNENWTDYAPDPGNAREYEGDYSALDVIQRSLRIYPDAVTKKLDLGTVFGHTESFGINGITHGNGFLRDGSYVYADSLRDALAHPGFQDDEVMDRINTGTRRFEYGDRPSLAALGELELAAQWERDGFRVVAFMPPYAPQVLEAMRATKRMGYAFTVGDAVRHVLERHHIPFVDYTSCAELGCVDDDFVNGFHAGSVLYARLLLGLARRAPWLEELTDRASLEQRLAGPNDAWELRQ